MNDILFTDRFIFSQIVVCSSQIVFCHRPFYFFTDRFIFSQIVLFFSQIVVFSSQKGFFPHRSFLFISRSDVSFLPGVLHILEQCRNSYISSQIVLFFSQIVLFSSQIVVFSSQIVLFLHRSFYFFTDRFIFHRSLRFHKSCIFLTDRCFSSSQIIHICSQLVCCRNSLFSHNSFLFSQLICLSQHVAIFFTSLVY